MDLRKQEGGIKEKLAVREPNFSLFTFLDVQAQRADIKRLIQYMKPTVIEKDGERNESVVEMKIEKIDLANLVQYLGLIESEEKVVSIKRLSIQSGRDDAGYLDVVLQMVTFMNKG